MTRRLQSFLVIALCALLAACGGEANGDRPSGEVEGDRAIGSPGAPVTIIEYASVVCPACQAFHSISWPHLKDDYIDTGKVRFIFREIPTAPSGLAMAGFMLARCAPEDKYFDVIDVLFDQREQLIRAASSEGGARESYLRIARAVGITEAQFDECTTSEDEIARIEQVGIDGNRQYGVSSTPTFVINGTVYAEVLSPERLDEILAPLLGEEAPASDDSADEPDES